MQFIEQRLNLLQIERVEAFGEPAIDRSEKVAGLRPPALIAPEVISSGPIRNPAASFRQLSTARLRVKRSTRLLSIAG
jgi:hypothetical protein